MIIGKTFKFEAAHCLPGHEKCGKVHGHTYKLTVEVKDRIHPNGMVMDLHNLSDLVGKVISTWDHSYLNDLFSQPTCENMVEAIWNGMIEKLVEAYLDPEILYSIQLQEGEGGYARKER
jgi:6-pyruvoyltetrahydropterin/6-carboxytetrahydropterin synthase